MQIVIRRTQHGLPDRWLWQVGIVSGYAMTRRGARRAALGYLESLEQNRTLTLIKGGKGEPATLVNEDKSTAAR